jgi:hypothetical protein
MTPGPLSTSPMACGSFPPPPPLLMLLVLLEPRNTQAPPPAEAVGLRSFFWLPIELSRPLDRTPHTRLRQCLQKILNKIFLGIFLGGIKGSFYFIFRYFKVFAIFSSERNFINYIERADSLP